MLNKITRLFYRQPAEPVNEPHSIPPDQHPLKPQLISRGASKVIEVLEQHGYQAYLVGGCVRDLMLGLHPKDFDVATNATPEQVRELFRRSRIVGRRFQIVHVRMRSEVIEVTTFRGAHDTGYKASRQESTRSSEGMLLRDNIFGTIDQDAARRDFTVNALYYHPQDNTVYDYANGQRDIGKRLLRIIGDPTTRYREDPVRMLRAVRFSAKLGFSIEPETAKPIRQLSDMLSDIPAARLFDETLKLLLNGHSLATFELLREFGLHEILFPTAAIEINQHPASLRFVEQALINTDQRIRANKRITPAFILAALLWPAVNTLRFKMEAAGDSPQYALQRAAGKIVADQCQTIAIPRRFTQMMREIWEMQLRLPNRGGSRAARLMENPRFRAGYDFLLLREQAGEIESGLGDWWTRYQEGDDKAREKMVADLSGRPQGNKRRRNRRKRRSGNAPSQND